MKYYLTLLLLTLVFIGNKIHAQDSSFQKKNNVIKGSISSMGIINGMYSIDYERSLISSQNFVINLEVSYGKYYQNTGGVFSSFPGFNSFTSSINGLFGKKSHLFELDLGIRYSIINDKYKENISPFLPVFNIGYRYQNPIGKGLVFRTFVGFTGVGISIGKAF